jgi:hypothetical protein
MVFNPGLWGETVRKALNPGEERAARDQRTGAEQSRLDKEDLLGLEQTGVYGELPEAPQPARPRGFFARLFRRTA